jgi:hypothetical protein
VAYQNTEELKDGAHSFYFAVDYTTWRDIIIDTYTRFNEVYKGLSHVPMERHDKLDEGIYLTTYANGVGILVDYNSGEFTRIEAGNGR